MLIEFSVSSSIHVKGVYQFSSNHLAVVLAPPTVHPMVPSLLLGMAVALGDTTASNRHSVCTQFVGTHTHTPFVFFFKS